MTLSPSNTYFAESAKGGDTTALTASITVGNTDLIVVKAQTWDAGTAAGTPSGGSLTYTRQVTTSTTGFATYGTMFTATATSSTTFTVTLSAPAASSYHTMLVEVWPGATVAATPATATAKYSVAGLPSMTITTAGTGSAVTTLCGDEQSVSPSTRAYSSSGTGESVGDGSAGSDSVQYYWYQQAATAGSQTVGMTAPTGQKWNMASLEIQAASGSTPISSSDTATGTEATSSLTAATSSADTAAGTEATSSLTAATSSTETGAGTEATSALSATTSSTETGTGTEATSALSATTSSTETAAGTEATSALSATTSNSDTGTGVDAGSVTAAASSSDTATGTESAQVVPLSSDTASSSESASVGLSGADTASVVETAVVTIFSSDSAVGTDALGTLTAAVSNTETGAGTDAQASSSAGLSSSDTAVGVEGQSVNTGGSIQVNDGETAVATEGQSLHVTLSGADTGTAVEGTSTLLATLSSADTATGVEAVVALLAALQGADTATIQESQAVGSGGNNFADSDSASSVEGQSVSIKGTGNGRVYPYYIRETQPWAIEQERRRHNQALWLVGETSMFALMWHIEDFNNGLVGRCRTCYTSQGAITEVYGQSDQNKCPDCFGTTFDGGFKALIIRPAIFSDTDEGETFHSRGVVHPNDLAIESTPDFRVRNGDYCFRQTGERYYLRVPERITLRTGYSLPTQQDHAIGYNHANAAVEDPTAVAYLIPPQPDETTAILRRSSRIPRDWSSYEVIRAPLIPTTITPPDA